MFDKLNKIREAWEINLPVVIEKEDENYLVIPLQLVNSENLQIFYEQTYEGLSVILPFSIQKDLEIPTYEILGRSVSSTFPIMTQLFRNNSFTKLKNYSIPIGVNENSNLDIPEFFRTIGDAIENRMDKSISKEEFRNLFYVNTMSPGPFTLLKSSFESLKTDKSIAELGVELAIIAKYPGGLLVTKLKDNNDKLFHREDGLEVIEETTIINLWRSMNKIQKEEIRYLE